jgi:serine/threonine protein kinase/tetratricopeptide (TPR) repeat protein
MNPETWSEVKRLLEDVLALQPADRRAFLDSRDTGPEVRAEVESLLALESEATGLMDIPAFEFSKGFFDGDERSMDGQMIGVYRVIGELQHGGMGAVYKAERADDKFEQTVALKLLKRELNTASLRRRFQHEREILASLEHPNIARLLDAGTTDDGIPFIAMEYVDGLPITQFCDQNGMGLDARLDLFRTVCTAVEFAHRNLVIHRDLKPSNILVTADGVPKLLDFGISKIISAEQDAADTATVTRMGVMTPSYASPEQLQRNSVTTQSDVYSLGVILYELLSGHRPFESKESDIRDIYQAVIESDPPPPSVVVTTSREEREPIVAGDGPSSRTRSNDPRPTVETTTKLSPQLLRGDLDNIVLKALRKEPERRYSSVEQLSDDIRRHQEGLTVTARPNTFSYRAGKFISRNRIGVFGTAIIALAVVAGLGATLWQARVAQAERVRAEKRFGDVRKLANSYLFDVYPEIENLEGSLKAREKILVSALEYLDSLSGEAEGDLELQSELATAYEKVGDVQGALTNSSLGNIQAGLDSYAKAAKLREAVYLARPNDLDAKDKLAGNYYTTARTLWNNSQTKEASEAFEKSLKLRRELVEADPASTPFQNRLAVLLIDYGAIPVFNSQPDKALVMFDEALGIVERLRSQQPDNPDFKKTQTRLLRLLIKTKGSVGDYDGAVAAYAKAIEINDQLAKEFPQDFRVQRSVWLTNTIMCEAYIDKQDPQKVVDACQPTIAFPKAALEKEAENGVVAYDLAISHFNTSRAYRIAGDLSKTIAQAELARSVMGKLSSKTPENMEYKRNLAVYDTERARAQISLGRHAEAGSVLQTVIETMIPIAAADAETTTYQYDLAIAYRLTAQTLSARGDKAKANEYIDKAIAIIQKLKDINSLRDADKDLLAELQIE